jgi:cell shape-determining protein MreC
LTQIIANLKSTKHELALLQAKLQKVEEENRKLTEQLKHSVAAKQDARGNAIIASSTVASTEPQDKPKPTVLHLSKPL